jgi:hypothetical protein
VFRYLRVKRILWDTRWSYGLMVEGKSEMGMGRQVACYDITIIVLNFNT